LTIARSFSLTASALAIACSGDPEAGFGVERAAIVNGEPSGDEDDEVVNILARTSDTTVQDCSAVLIAPNVVLTALHCVVYRQDPNATFSCNIDGTIRPNEPNAGSFGAPVDGADVQIFVGPERIDQEPDAIGERVFGSGATQICRGDLAAVVLDRELSQDFAPVRFGRNVEPGEALIAIGYGQTGIMGDGGRHRRDVTVVDVGDVGCVQGTGPTPPDTFVVTEGPCHGDSGGPALSAETGAVTGVYSLTLAPSCTAFGASNTYALVSPYEDVIREALEYAGREPLLEPMMGEPPECTGTGGTDPTGEGSGSRDDASCACRAAGGRHPAYGFYALVLAAFAAVRRRGRSRGR
jgi:MYXO-CTERM domain-containing protein